MRTDKRECGCYIERIGHMPARIVYCPLHESVAALRGALAEIITESHIHYHDADGDRMTAVEAIARAALESSNA